jgi:hypothetical protein
LCHPDKQFTSVSTVNPEFAQLFADAAQTLEEETSAISVLDSRSGIYNCC